MTPRYSTLALCSLLVYSLWVKVSAETIADHGSERAEPTIADDVQDIVLLGPTGPVHIRLHIVVNGLGFRQAWRQAVDDSFAHFDTEKKGRLTSDEASRLFALFNPGQLADIGIKKSQTSAAMMMKPQPLLSLDDVLAQLAKTAPPFSVRSSLSSHGAGPALFSLLDTDGDGALSRAELKAADSNLRCRDFNDNGLITAEELVLGPPRVRGAGNVASANSTLVDGPIITLGPATPPESLVDALLFRYDRNHDGRLSFGTAPIEIRSANNAFAKFDTNQDQSLDRAELSALVTAPPDIEIAFTFGHGAVAGKSAEDHSANADAAFRLRRKLDGGYRLTIGENEVDFRRNNRDPSQSNQNPQLSDYDQNKDGFLSGDELTAAGLAANLPLVDTNGDRKVSAEEFDAYMKWQSQIAASRVVLQATDEGQDLFALLDTNGDGFLSARELKNADAILATEDADHDGVITSRDIPYRVLLELSRGGPSATNSNVAAISSLRQPRRCKPTVQPPDWSTKMDRNGDGDLTPEEFLGTRAQFDKLDTNHDGLIDFSEAAAAGAEK
jgi:Ca2+-binding EF-hand superfamily protein